MVVALWTWTPPGRIESPDWESYDKSSKKGVLPYRSCSLWLGWLFLRCEKRCRRIRAASFVLYGEGQEIEEEGADGGCRKRKAMATTGGSCDFLTEQEGVSELIKVVPSTFVYVYAWGALAKNAILRSHL